MSTAMAPISDKIINRFLGEADRRNLDKPWVRGGYRYYSDSFVILRLPAPDAVDTLTQGPNMAHLPWSVEWVTFEPWPSAAYVFEEKWEKCDACEEDYRTFQPSHRAQRIGNRLIATRLHYSISLLPDVEYAPDPAGKFNAPLYFRFNGGDGLVMPMNPELINRYNDPDAVCPDANGND